MTVSFLILGALLGLVVLVGLWPRPQVQEVRFELAPAPRPPRRRR